MISPMLYAYHLQHKGPTTLAGLTDFRFETIPDGLPPSDVDATQDIPSLCESTTKTCLVPFCNLLTKLNNATPEVPPVTCKVSDGVMSFTLKAAEQFGLLEVLFCSTSVCGFLGYMQYSCVEWGMRMEIDNNVKRDEVEELVKELMDCEKEKKMKEEAMEWKKKAEEATAPVGSSFMNFEELVKLQNFKFVDCC
ncbi:7-deoxyloganetin glucosyltransferase-like [Olea europaea subsp. europaea]|uniref:7-deoxyloganetin glucosyltransferase-like n=1 Tax=Olea europaea subsp. europaea TaxID=158383 RepID=A0A8S0SRL0_OLEEU|nr:7-deoxyloganetin glucosyltransferase-like [Olea europaea subsp. europaea]